MAIIALHNTADVDLEALQAVAGSAGLPPGRICLIVGDPLLDERYQGCTIARDLVPWAGNIHSLRSHLREEWECGVVIGKRWAERQGAFPAYFAYLLAHEFGHATTVLTRLWLAVYEDMILQYMPRIVNDRRWRWDEFPHEIRYDQFGIGVAQAVYGRTALEAEFNRILTDGLTEDAPRLVKALALEPTTDLEPLPRELAAFTRPFRDQLLARWRADIEDGTLKLGAYLRDLNYLWTDEF